jgi:four helix bundle protein
MVKVIDFIDFDAFKACRAFVRETGLLVRTPSFASNRNLANQMERASISVLSNFAEGYERDGNALVRNPQPMTRNSQLVTRNSQPPTRNL